MVGELSVSQKTSLITFIPKGGDQTSIKNWRPISLLCSDYKILSKVLTNRSNQLYFVTVKESIAIQLQIKVKRNF